MYLFPNMLDYVSEQGNALPAIQMWDDFLRHVASKIEAMQAFVNRLKARRENLGDVHDEEVKLFLMHYVQVLAHIAFFGSVFAGDRLSAFFLRRMRAGEQETVCG